MSIAETGRDILSLIVRATGLLLLFVGLWLALMVLYEAWDLYREPARIERYAQAIEKGSNIDKSIAPLRESLAEQEKSEETGNPDTSAEPPLTTGKEKPPVPAPEYQVRLSYFLAWIIVLLLLLLMARISLAAIRTGGELVLYEAQIKRLARELARETRES